MKKFMRIALVFALAGATLVGCTKDYSGDISDLNKKVSEQTTAISALQTQVATALSEAQKALSEAQAAAKAASAAEESAEIDALAARVTTLEAAMQSVNDVLAGKANASDLAAAKTALEGAIASINDVLAGKADAAEVAATYATIEALAGKANVADVDAVKAAIEALQANVEEHEEAFEATKASLEGAIATINAALEGKADKAEVAATYATIAALTETNNSLAALQATVGELTETVAANKEAGEAADAAIIADLAKANQAIADAVATANKAVADLRDEVKEMLKAYYTKDEIDAIIEGLSTSLYETIAALTETNNSLAALHKTVEELAATVAANKEAGEAADAEIKADLAKANQAIADAVVAANKAVADLKNEVTEMLKDYYTKAEIDALVAGLNTSLDNLKEYINGQFDALITNINVLKGKNVYVRYARWDGVQELKKGKWVAAEWEGPRADDAASEEFGGYVTAPFSTSNRIDVQINPTSFDLSTSEFVLEDATGFQAPVSFGEAYETPVVKVKGANGLWSIPFVTGDFDAATVKALAKKKSDTKYALVVNDNVRTTYDFTFSYGEINGTNEEKSGATFDTEIIVPYDEIDGDFEIEPSGYATRLYDAYLTATRTSDIVRYGVELDGMTISYDAEAVLKNPTVQFKVTVKQLNIAGYVSTQEITVKFGSAEEPEPVIIPVFSESVYHIQATPVVANQTALFDAAEFIEAIGSADERLLWADEFKLDKKAIVLDYIFNKYDEYEDTDEVDEIDAVLTDAEGETDDIDNNNFTHFKVAFNDYAGEEFGKEYTALLVFANKKRDVKYQFFVTFVVDEPTAEEVASWYNWKDATVRISDSNKGSDGVYATVNPSNYFDGEDAEGNVLATLAYTKSETAGNTFITSFVKATDKTVNNAWFAPGISWKNDGYMDPQYDNAKNVTSFKLVSQTFENWKNNTSVLVLANKTADYTVTGLVIEAMGRTYPAQDFTVKVISINHDDFDYSIDFNAPIKLYRAQETPSNFWFGYNSNLAPVEGEAFTKYKGSFSISGVVGNNISITQSTYRGPETYNEGRTDNSIDCTYSSGNVSVNGHTVTTDSEQSYGSAAYKLYQRNYTGGYSLRRSGGNSYTLVEEEKEKTFYVYRERTRTVDIPVLESVVTSNKYNSETKEWQNCELYTVELVEYTPEKTSESTCAIKITPKKDILDAPETVHVILQLAKEGLKYISDGTALTEDITVEFDINLVD